MLLRDAVIYGSEERKNIFISNGKISRIANTKERLPDGEKNVIELNGATVFPGFINSHDHLEFNCYPQLGKGPYHNYTEWGRNIHKQYAEEIAAVQKIPEHLRIQWGLYKNLLNGFTTVVNHGKKINVGNELVNVFQDCRSLHSVAFEKGWKLKLNNPFHFRKPYVIHAGEGTDDKAEKEIDQLIQSNYLRKKVVAVHGVAMKEEQASSIKGLVWCPASNYFLLGKTAAVDRLKHKTMIVFGTDSTLTAPFELKPHLADCISSGMVTEAELAAMLTGTAAALWGLPDRGIIEIEKKADMVILQPTTRFSAGHSGNIWLVLVNGEIRVASGEYAKRVALNTALFDRILFCGEEILVKKGLNQLMKEILAYYPFAFSFTDIKPVF